MDEEECFDINLALSCMYLKQAIELETKSTDNEVMTHYLIRKSENHMSDCIG